jgi:hypothetical protein
LIAANAVSRKEVLARRLIVPSSERNARSVRNCRWRAIAQVAPLAFDGQAVANNNLKSLLRDMTPDGALPQEIAAQPIMQTFLAPRASNVT